jgi:hypothetical protein
VFSSFLKFLYRTGWEFWLPLPLIAGLLWVSGNLLAARILNRAYDSPHTLQSNVQLDARLSTTILSINAEIDRGRGVTTIWVRTTSPTLKRLKYEFPMVQAFQVEATLAQELEIPVGRVQELISYRIKD